MHIEKSVGPDGKKDVRIAIDYRFVIKFTEPSVALLEDMAEIFSEGGCLEIHQSV
jgi:hypothetical protein